MSARSSAARPKLLFLCQTLPFPPDGGVSIRTYNVLRLLARTFDITALCFYRASVKVKSEQVEESLAALGQLARVEAFPIPQEHSRIRLVQDHLRSVFGRRVYTRDSYNSEAFRARLRELRRGNLFDLVHVDSLDLSAYLPLLNGVPVICVHHNVESELLRRRAVTEHSLFRRAYLRHQAALMAKEEEQWCPRVALNIVVSEQDRNRLKQRIPSADFAVVPNGVDVDAFRPSPHGGEGMVFVGGTTWFPNRDALEFFSDEILPRIRAAGEQAPVRWVGRARADEQARYGRHGLEVTGYVDDIRPYVQDAACYVVPLRVGGGTRLKILDAWAMGKAIVSTSIGCEGLEAADGENILIRDEPAAFAEAVVRLNRDSELRRRLGEAARATAERVYSWEVIADKMLSKYLSLAEAAQPARRAETR